MAAKSKDQIVQELTALGVSFDPAAPAKNLLAILKDAKVKAEGAGVAPSDAPSAPATAPDAAAAASPEAPSAAPAPASAPEAPAAAPTPASFPIRGSFYVAEIRKGVFRGIGLRGEFITPEASADDEVKAIVRQIEAHNTYHRLASLERLELKA